MIAKRIRNAWPGILMGLAAVVGLLVSLAFSAASDKSAGSSIARAPISGPMTEQQSMAIEGARNLAGGSFGASLEMKENAEFLLTPALLVQDVVSPGAIITYPEE